MGTIACLEAWNGPWQVEPGQVWKLQGGESHLGKDVCSRGMDQVGIGPLAPLSDPAQSRRKHLFKRTVTSCTPERSLLLCWFTHCAKPTPLTWHLRPSQTQAFSVQDYRPLPTDPSGLSDPSLFLWHFLLGGSSEPHLGFTHSLPCFGPAYPCPVSLVQSSPTASPSSKHDATDHKALFPFLTPVALN